MRARTQRTAQPQQPQSAAHVTTIGVKRPDFGTLGRPLDVYVNSYVTTIPDKIIIHYDVAISGSEKPLPARVNMRIIKELQYTVAPEIFTPRAAYDGRKNLFSMRVYPFGDKDSQDFTVNLEDPGMLPKVYKVRLTKVAEINPEVLTRFISGRQSHDNSVLTAITALNVVIRMEPTMAYPFNTRSFFTDKETKSIGGGIVLWRGYFQSIRPGIGKMLINVDISTSAMYQGGPLISLCLAFLGIRDPSLLVKSRIDDRDFYRLRRFLSGLRIQLRFAQRNPVVRAIKGLSSSAAERSSIVLKDGSTVPVVKYFEDLTKQRLRFPGICCVEMGSRFLVPLELCEVVPGQFLNQQVPQANVREVLDFATKKPEQRLQSIREALTVLAYGQSDYVRQFGMRVSSEGPLKIQARVLRPPTLKYGVGSKDPQVVPSKGAWSMTSKHFYRPATVTSWGVAIFESRQRFREQTIQQTLLGLKEACSRVGISLKAPAHVDYYNAQGDISKDLLNLGKICFEKTNKTPPQLIVAVLPENAADIYAAIKYFGNHERGVATQCLKGIKCSKGDSQYFTNVCLKLNVKLGGINVIPDPSSAMAISETNTPTLVMGADVIHPSPGSTDLPSYTAIVGNVDSGHAKYVAESKAQTGRQELIDDLDVMCMNIMQRYMEYAQKVERRSELASKPKRIIFYRDGVSEGQFKQVLEVELPLLKRACESLKIKAKITFIVVVKRHHVRFFPQRPSDADHSGNCPAGTVVDREIAHPTEFDFYLQSHSGILGTSRPAHYSVLYDENKFSADELQSLTFTLCHVYARSTRSVSIPAPVYYADLVCSKALTRYDPKNPGSLGVLNAAVVPPGSISPANSLEAHKQEFKPIHSAQKNLMYFS